MNEINLRAYRPSDNDEIVRLFYESVHHVAAKDYSPEQLAAWAPDDIDPDVWCKALAESETLVAECGGVIAGFANLVGDYLDRLYVHRDFQSRGMASTLLQRLEESALASGRTELKVEASITAKGFFSHKGFILQQAQMVCRKGILLENFVMIKKLKKS